MNVAVQGTSASERQTPLYISLAADSVEMDVGGSILYKFRNLRSIF